MSLVTCPDCDRDVSDNAESCPNCGHPMSESDPEQGAMLRAIGIFLFIVGAAAAVYYYQYFDTTVAVEGVELFGQTFGGGRVHNIGLMEERRTGLILSCVGAIGGLVLVAFSERAKP